MTKCYKCGVESEKATLYEGVSKGGVVLVCSKCFFLNKIPLVDTKNVDMTEINKKQTVRDRLSIMAGIKPKEVETRKSVESVELKQIVEDNFKKSLSKEARVYENLADNFHWTIMRARRSLKWTQKEFADKIFEPLIVVEHLEKGFLPKDYLSLIKKIEGVLGIPLLSEGERKIIPSLLANESKVSSGLKLSDLRPPKESSAYKNYNAITAVPKTETSKIIVPKTDKEIIDAEMLDLKEVEKIVGRPLEEVRKKTKTELSEEEIRKLIFRK